MIFASGSRLFQGGELRVQETLKRGVQLTGSPGPPAKRSYLPDSLRLCHWLQGW